MKRLVLGCVVVTLCGGVALWVGWPRLVEWLRVRLEHEVSRVVGVPSRVEVLSISLAPLSVRLGGVAVGAEPVVARVAGIEAQLHGFASLAEWRPVLTIRVDSVAADLTHLPANPPPMPARAPAAASGGLRLPPLRLEAFSLAGAELRFRMGKDVAQLTVGRIGAHIETTLLGGGVTAGIEVQDADLKRKSYRARVHLIQAVGGADAGGLFVEHARLEGDDVSASARATVIPHRHAVSGTFNPAVLGIVVDELSSVTGEAHVEGTLIGDLANPVLDGRLTIQQGAIGGRLLGDLDTHVGRAGPTLRFDDLRLVGASGTVTGAVDLTVVGEVPIHGDLTWTGVDLERLLGVIGAPVPFNNRLTATTAVHGALDPLDLDVRGDGTLHSADADAPKEVGRFEITGHVMPHNVDATLAVTQPQNHVTTQVLIAGTQFGGTVRLKAADLAALGALLPRPVSSLGMTGRGEATAEFSGSTEHPVVKGTLALSDVTVSGVKATRLGGDFHIAAATLTTKSLALEARTGGVELNGALALDEDATNDWRLGLRDLSTDLLLGLAYTLTETQLPIGGGSLNGTLLCKGPWLHAETDTNLTATALRVAGEPLERVDVKASTTLPRWSLYLQATRTPSETLTIQGAGEGETNLQLTIDSTPLNLGTLRGAGRRRLTGVVTLQGQVSGALRQPSGGLQLAASGVGGDGHELGNLSLLASGKAGEWKLRGTALDDTLTLDASVRNVGAVPFSLALVWQDTDLSQALSEDRSLQVATSGALRLTGALRALQDLTGSLRVTQFAVRRDEVHVEAPEPIRIELDKGRFRIESLELAAAGSRLSVAGEGRLSGQLDLDVRGEGDLVLLEVIGQPFYSARGQFGVTAHIARSAARRWTLRGQAKLRNAALDLGLPISFTDTNGDFSLLGAKVLVENLTGRSGGGEFGVSGRVHLKRGPALSWWLRDVGLTFPEWLEERVSGKGRVQGTWEVLTVSGDVDVLTALYDKKIELTGLIPWFKEQVAPAPRIGEPRTEVRLDLRIQARDGLFVDNNFSKSELAADLHISGTATQPSLEGKVEVLYGEVTVGSRVFTITGGSAVFQSGERINPILNITADSQVAGTDAEYTVRVAVTGPADNPRVAFSSDDPNLSQNDVLSLVALGRTTREQPRDSGVSMGDLLSYLPTEYTGDVSQQIRSIFGVDRFEVDPAYVRNTGSIEPRVTIGKDITSRIRALASSSLGVDPRNTMQVEYRITSRISLLATWESASSSEAGAFGGDIKFRYEFRKLPFSLLSSDLGLSQGDAR